MTLPCKLWKGSLQSATKEEQNQNKSPYANQVTYLYFGYIGCRMGSCGMDWLGELSYFAM